MRNGLPFSKPRVRLHGDPGEAQAHLGEAYGLLYKVRQFCERSGVPVFAMSRDLPGGGHVTAAVVGAEEIVSVYPARYAQHIEEQELLDKEPPLVFCAWHTFQTAAVLPYPYGFYAVYLGAKYPMGGSSPLPEGYYSSVGDVFLGPLQLSGGGPWMGDVFQPFPFPVPYAEDDAYFSNPYGVYIAPAAYTGGGLQKYRWALVSPSGVVKEDEFGPLDQARYRYPLNFSHLPVTYKNTVRTHEFPGSNDPNFRNNRRLANIVSVRDYINENYPSGVPSGVNPSFSFDSASLDYTNLHIRNEREPACFCVTSRGLHWVEQRAVPGQPSSLLHTSDILDGIVQEPRETVVLQSAYSWTIATDDKHIAVGGWSHQPLGGIVEVYTKTLEFVTSVYFPWEDLQPQQIGYERGLIAAINISEDTVLTWDISDVLEGGNVVSSSRFQIGLWRPDGSTTNSPIFSRACAVKAGKIFVMSTGNLRDTVIAQNTGECLVDVFEPDGEHIRTITLSVPRPSAAFADVASQFSYAMVSMVGNTTPEVEQQA